MPPALTSRSTVFALAAMLDGRTADPSCDPQDVVTRAIDHRVSALLLAAGGTRTLPEACIARLDADARLRAVHAAVLDDELRGVLAALDARDVVPIVVKGAHFAHQLYAAPHLRPRADSDLLIPADARRAAATALADAGYARSAVTSGSVVLGEFTVERRLRGGIVHYVDVHWRAAAPLVFDRTFDAARLIAHARPLPALGSCARAPAPADALALACVHLVAHHWTQSLLIWLYDIRLLVESLDAHDAARFVDAAVEHGYSTAAGCALRTARLYFRSAALDALLALLTPRANEAEPSAALLLDGRRGVDDLLLDLRLAGWRERAQLLREHVLPPAHYVRARFGGPLALAYARRLVRGIAKWF